MTLIIALLPIIAIAIYIYGKDKNKEPKQLLFKLFLAGLVSTTITLVLTILLGIIIPIINVEKATELTGISLFIHTFIGVGLIEELSKWLMTYIISFNNKEFDELYDIIIYSVFVSLGFAGLENLLYVSEGGLVTAIFRALLSVPGHACLGIFMGYYLGLAKISELKKDNFAKIKNILLSLIIPTILHGIYDYCLLSRSIISIIIFFLFIFILYIQSYKKINKSAKEAQSLKNINISQDTSKNKNTSHLHNQQITQTAQSTQYSNNYCPNCGIQVNSNFCPNCGTKISNIS